MSWYIRKVIQWATLYVTVTHRTEDGIEKITVEQVLSGGAGASTEERILDWEERPVDDKVFGPLITKTRRIKLEDLENEYLRNGFIDDGNGVIETHGVSDTPKSGNTWEAETVRASRDEHRRILQCVSRHGDCRILRSMTALRKGTRDMCISLDLEEKKSMLYSCMIMVSLLILSYSCHIERTCCPAEGPLDG